MQGVGPAPCGNPNLDRISAVLGAEVEGLNAEFRNGVHVGNGCATLVHGRVREETVELEGGLIVALPLALYVGASFPAGLRVRILHAGNERDQRQRVRRYQRQI